MTTLFEATLALAKKVTKVTEGAATGGSATTLEDTLRLKEQNEYWTDGTLWLPTYEAVRQVTSFDGNTLGFEALDPIEIEGEEPETSAVAEGDEYAVADPDYPYTELRRAVNAALREIGPVIVVNDDLTVDSTQGPYVLPVGVSKLADVWVMDPDDENSRYKSEHWEEEDGYLMFDPGWQPSNDGWTIKLYYLTQHPLLADPDDEISSSVDDKRLLWQSVVELLKDYGMRRYGGDDKRAIGQFLQDAIQEADRLKSRRNRGTPVVRVHAAG